MSANESSETRQQVIAVGTPLPSPSLPQNVQQGPVMVSSKSLHMRNKFLIILLKPKLTSKNLQCMNGMAFSFHFNTIFD